MKKKRKCPICNSPNTSILYIQRYANNVFHTIVSCNNCLFVFVNNSLSQKDYNEYYKNMSKYEHERDETLHFQYIKIIRKFLDPKSKVLDIGCSAGHFLYVLRKNGFSHILGIDRSPKCKPLALEKFNISIGTAELFSYKPDKQYYLRTLNAVMEHSENLQEAVEKIKKLLTRNGHVFISVPDAGNFHDGVVEEPFGEFSI